MAAQANNNIGLILKIGAVLIGLGSTLAMVKMNSSGVAMNSHCNKAQDKSIVELRISEATQGQKLDHVIMQQTTQGKDIKELLRRVK